MRKVITIGESIMDIIYKDGSPISSYTGGRIINIAAATATAGINTIAVSECGADMIGDLIIEYLNKHGVQTKSIDRFTDGNTSLSMIFADQNQEKRMRYGKYPADRFDVVWPRIDEDDIIVFGSFYSLDATVRERLFEMITYATQRKAIIIYLPGFHREPNYRITKVMTAILENLEVSNIVIAKDSDAQNIFDKSDAQNIFNDKIAFYCPNYIQIDSNYNISLFAPQASLSRNNNNQNIVNSLSWHSGFCAGLIYGIIINNISLKNINNIDSNTWNNIISHAQQFAEESHLTGTNCISDSFGETCKTEISKIDQDSKIL